MKEKLLTGRRVTLAEELSEFCGSHLGAGIVRQR